MKKTFVIEEIPVKKPKDIYKGSDKEKIIIIDTILNMYPQLKRDRTLIINSVLGKVEKPSTVLEKIIHDNKTYYRDEEGKIFDVEVKLRGCYTRDSTTGQHTYYMFSESNLAKELGEVNRLSQTFYSNKN